MFHCFNLVICLCFCFCFFYFPLFLLIYFRMLSQWHLSVAGLEMAEKCEAAEGLKSHTADPGRPLGRLSRSTD